MANAKREIECLNRLKDLGSSSLYDIVQFLEQEKLIDKDFLTAFKHSGEKAKEIHKKLTELSASEKLQLLEYTWTLLPVERISILLITDRDKKEFTYNI